jgi:hypothetical protein
MQTLCALSSALAVAVLATTAPAWAQHPGHFASRAALQALASRIPGAIAHPGHQSLAAAQ